MLTSSTVFYVSLWERLAVYFYVTLGIEIKIMQIVRKLAENFATQFRSDCTFIQAPGRINLIGEHTDYNNGFVLPAAIDRYMHFAVAKNQNPDVFSVYSPHFDEIATLSFGMTSLAGLPSWAKYLQAALMEMESRGLKADGINAVIDGDIPVGAGLSSSAALCCGFIYAIAHLNDFRIPRPTIALIAQATEHRVGLNCGLMDQYAVLFGKEQNVFSLDCKHLTVEYHPLRLQNYSIVLMDSKIKHELAADSGYNDRRAACERVVEIAKKTNSAVESLRDLSKQDLIALKPLLNPKDFQRANYVLDENQRVLLTRQALQEERLATVGQYLYQSQQGMQYEYEITIPEIDLLVDLTKPLPEVIGSRLVGGGFGGCTISLVQTDKIDEVIEKITTAYYQQTKIQPEAYELKPADGVKVTPV